MRKNKVRIISIEPTEEQYLSAVMKDFPNQMKRLILEESIDMDKLREKFDIINGSWIGGIEPKKG